MNILHIKYAAEVARLGSLNKAADVLMIAQPKGFYFSLKTRVPLYTQ